MYTTPTIVLLSEVKNKEYVEAADKTVMYLVEYEYWRPWKTNFRGSETKQLYSSNNLSH